MKSILGEFPVVVAGAGPVGLALGLALARAGVPAVIFDPRPGIPRAHRATTLQPRTLEQFAEWGVLDAIVQAGVRVDRVDYREHGERPDTLAQFDFRHIEADTDCPYRVHLDQFSTCDILLDAVRADQPEAVRWGHKVTDFTDRGDHVEVAVTGPDRVTRTQRGSVLVAADGHGSSLRVKLGTLLAGSGVSVGFISASAPLGVLDASEIGLSTYLYDRSGWAQVMTMADRVRLLFQAPAGQTGEEATGNAAMDALARRWLRLEEGILRSMALYTVRPGVATRWRTGRVVLAGDAAHAAYPVGGTAMNCGIQDAHVLAAALRQGTDTALDGYASSRQAWAAMALVHRATESLQSLSASGMWNRASRRRHLRAVAADPAKSRQHLLRLSMLDDRI